MTWRGGLRNIELIEFYFAPARCSAFAAQNYISSNYTHAARDITRAARTRCW
jgi:hypothetical protein